MIEYIDNKTIYHNYNDSDKGIYKITFNVNDEQQIYIGQTRTTFRKRIRKHLYDCRKGKHCGTFQSI